MKALIFDMDDTLVRSTPIWRAAETHLLHKLGATWTPELALTYKGMNALDVARVIHSALRPATALHECQQIMRQHLIDGFAHGAEAMPGAVELVRAARAAECFRLAVASGSPLPAIEQAMRPLGILDHFDLLLSSESVPRGKPAPDVFLEAARRLGCSPNDCTVFEDSLIGVQAACAAGMRCIAVPSCHPDEIRRLAHRVCTSLGEVAPASL